MIETLHAVIIEDDRLNAKVLETLLRQEGVAVTVIRDPAQAIAILDARPTPDVFFVDLEMPHLDGYEVLAILRERYGNRMPIAAYTVHTNEIINAVGKGFNGFFAKPINGAKFHEKLQQLLRGEQVFGIQ